VNVGDLVKFWGSEWKGADFGYIGIIVGCINTYPREVFIKWNNDPDVAGYCRQELEGALEVGDLEILNESR
jgi:hypothetical protein